MDDLAGDLVDDLAGDLVGDLAGECLGAGDLRDGCRGLGLPSAVGGTDGGIGRGHGWMAAASGLQAHESHVC